MESPFGSLDDVLDAAASAPPRPVLLWPGRHDTPDNNLFLTSEEGGPALDGFDVRGCGADQVVLEARRADSPVITVAGVRGVRFSDLAIVGGTWSVWARELAQVTFERAVFRGFRDGSIFNEGAAGDQRTEVTVNDCEIEGQGLESESSQFGVFARRGGLARVGGGTVVRRARGAGLVAQDDARLELDDVDVVDVSPDAEGRFGRGVHVEDSTFAVTELKVDDTTDVGVWLARSSGNLTDVFVTSTHEGLASDGTATGDGIVLTGKDVEGRQLNPATFRFELSRIIVGGADRVGILAEGVTATFDNAIATEVGSACLVCYSEDADVVFESGQGALTDVDYVQNRTALRGSVPGG